MLDTYRSREPLGLYLIHSKRVCVYGRFVCLLCIAWDGSAPNGQRHGTKKVVNTQVQPNALIRKFRILAWAYWNRKRASSSSTRRVNSPIKRKASANSGAHAIKGAGGGGGRGCKEAEAEAEAEDEVGVLTLAPLLAYGTTDQGWSSSSRCSKASTTRRRTRSREETRH